MRNFIRGIATERARRRPALRGALVALCLLGVVGCATRPAVSEPANLQPLKEQLRAYVAAGRYERDLAAVAADARTWIEQRVARRQAGERLAVVFDLDETLFLNWPHIERNDFGYVPAVWQHWVDEARAAEIAPVREVYRTARRLGCAIILITGRPERDRASTVRNLQAIECADFVALICKPDGARGTAAAFKTAARERMSREGWTIIANLGDQTSDLAGGWSERVFKLPNPFYQTE